MANSTTTHTSTVVMGNSKFKQLLIKHDPAFGSRARLILETTKNAFEKELEDLRKRVAAIKLQIKGLEDFSSYILGRGYNPAAWVDRRIRLELRLKEAEHNLSVVEDLYEEYFGDGTSTTTSSTTAGGSTSSSSTTHAPGSSTSSTTHNPNTSSSSTTMNTSSSSTTANPNTSSSSTTLNPNTSSSSTTVNPNTSSSSTTLVPGSSTSSSTTLQDTINFTANLNGASEVPPVGSGASAHATLAYNKLTKVLRLRVEYTGIIPIAAHIHKGAVGEAGPVVFTLDHTQNPIIFTSVPLTDEQECNLKAGLYYVNLHTAFYPDGEIRGQLVKQ